MWYIRKCLAFTKLEVNFEICKRHYERDNNNYTLKISGNQQIKKACDYLYKNANIYLNRKYNTYFAINRTIKIF